jgi:L-threonylcarbamoyladenylate synthase
MMKTQIFKQEDPRAIALAQELLQAGEVVAFPTDTVYGIGVRSDMAAAIDKLYQVKARSMDKSIPVMIASIDQLHLLVDRVPDMARRLAEKFWPGPLTMVLPKRENLPWNLTHLSGVGVRIPNHPFVLDLLSRCGPLAVTSANLSGQPDALNAEDVIAQLEGQLSLVVDGGRSQGAVASTVVDLTGVELRIIREGPISYAMINQTLGDLLDIN